MPYKFLLIQHAVCNTCEDKLVQRIATFPHKARFHFDGTVPQGWVIVSRIYGEPVLRCPECEEKNKQAREAIKCSTH